MCLLVPPTDHSSACRSNHRPENVSRWTVWANTRYKVCSTSHTKCTSHLHQKLLNSLLHMSWWYSIHTLLRGGIYWVVHPRRPRDFPRVKPQGLLEVGGEVHPIPHHQQGRIGLTLSILPCPQGSISWSTPCKKIDDERMFVLHQNSWGIGKSWGQRGLISQHRVLVELRYKVLTIFSAQHSSLWSRSRSLLRCTTGLDFFHAEGTKSLIWNLKAVVVETWRLLIMMQLFADRANACWSQRYLKGSSGKYMVMTQKFCYV